ncbi:MAG: hypothetical protein U0163_15995 [Gemmatimonadaceae bacterium]
MTPIHRPRRAVTAGIVACTALAVLACNSGNPQTTPVQVSTQVSPTQIVIGDTMRVITTAYITGAGRASVESHTCDSPFEVLDSSGRVVGPGRRACQPVCSRLGGSSYALPGFWTGLSSDSRPGNPRYVPAGTYQIRGVATVLELSSPVRGTLLTVTLRQP